MKFWTAPLTMPRDNAAPAMKNTLGSGQGLFDLIAQDLPVLDTGLIIGNSPYRDYCLLVIEKVKSLGVEGRMNRQMRPYPKLIAPMVFITR